MSETKIQPSSVLTIASQSLKEDAKSAAWRTAGRTAIDAAHKPFVAALRKYLPAKQATAVAAFLDTENGRAGMAVVLGCAPFFIPQLASNDRASRLATEMRIQGIQTFSDRIGRDFFQPIIEAFTKALAVVPMDEAS